MYRLRNYETLKYETAGTNTVSEPVSAPRSLTQGTTGVASIASCLSVDHRIDW
jgi:hypothetical protein